MYCVAFQLCYRALAFTSTGIVLDEFPVFIGPVDVTVGETVLHISIYSLICSDVTWICDRIVWGLDAVRQIAIATFCTLVTLHTLPNMKNLLDALILIKHDF